MRQFTTSLLTRKGLVVLVINVGQSKDIVTKWAMDLRISYPVLLDANKEMATWQASPGPA